MTVQSFMPSGAGNSQLRREYQFLLRLKLQRVKTKRGNSVMLV